MITQIKQDYTDSGRNWFYWEIPIKIRVIVL